MSDQTRSASDRPDDVVVLPSAVDPALADAVVDAMAGPQARTSPHDPDRVLGADPHDFAGLYIRHRSAFSSHARRFLRDPRDVDEVVQEAFLRLFLALPELDSELQALSYCRRTITNLCIDRYRADQRRPRLVDLESVPVDVLGEDEQDDPVVQAEDAALVREALALLSPLHREALVKREIEEKALPVIARELDVPEESVKHLLHRARRALRRRLAETHLAPGVELEDVSTLSLLARSAVSGTGRVGVFVLLAVGLALGATTKVPVEAIETISGLWHPDPAPARASDDRLGPDAAPPVPQQPSDVVALDDPGPIVAAPDPILPPQAGAPALPVAPVPPAQPATSTVTASPSPSASSRPTPTSGPSDRPRPSALPSLPPVEDPRPEPSGSPSPGPAPSSSRSAQPSPQPSPEGSPSGSATLQGRFQPEPDEHGPVLAPQPQRVEG